MTGWRREAAISAGFHELSWNTNELAGGIYFAILKSKDF